MTAAWKKYFFTTLFVLWGGELLEEGGLYGALTKAFWSV